MKRLVRIKCLLMALFVLSVCMSSCIYEDEPIYPPEKERLILIYAVAANNLQYNLTLDMQEILKIASTLDLDRNKVLVYSVVNSGECKLQQLVKDKKGNYNFDDVITFSDLPLSTSPERMQEVYDYVNENYDYPEKGLILWSHATGWVPWFGGNTPDQAEQDKRKAFGQDKFEGGEYWMNITDLAEAIPTGMFDFIWFDCCYMANIETIYQLREKTPYIIGYVTEIASDGMPYHLTMPYLLKKEPNLVGAAENLYDYYSNKGIAVSVSIIDTSKLDLLAEASSNIFSQGILPPDFIPSGIQNYGRQGYKFYDMKQLLDIYQDVGEGLKMQLNAAFEEAVIYKAISDYDFNDKPINVSDYSGLSMHNYTDDGSQNNAFYRELDWFKSTRSKANVEVPD